CSRDWSSDVCSSVLRLEEQVQILNGLWKTPPGETFAFSGEHYTLVESPALPKPAQAGGPPIIIGGFGAKPTPRLAARYADEYNVPFKKVGETGEAFDRVRAACAEGSRAKPPRRPPAHVVRRAR